MNVLTTIKQRMKNAKKKVAVAAASAGTAFAIGASNAFAIDTTATGPIGSAITQGQTDYEAVFAMVIATVVVFWALHELKKVFFGK